MSPLRRPFLLTLICAATLGLFAGISPSCAQSVVVMVNGEPITSYDIDQRSRLILLSTHKAATRKQVIDDLIDEKVKIKEAKKYGVDPSGGEIDASFAAMSQRMRLSPEQLTQMLAGKGIRPATLKSRIRAEMVWTSLVRGRFKDSLLVADKAVRSATGDGTDGKGEGANFEYHMRPIVLVVPRGSSASELDMRRKEAEALRAKVRSCDDALAISRSVRNATIRDTVIKTSADLPKPLREVLDKTEVGHLTPPEVTRQGIEMVALCDRKASTGDTPEQRQLREKIYAQKFEAKSKTYLQEIRNAAMIEYR